MHRDETTTPEDLERPEGNGLEANYELHDVGHREVVERLNDRGLDVHEWGIDMRHDDGEDGIIFDDKMDFKIVDPDHDEVIALVDVKTKSSPSYMGRFNERHYDHYRGYAEAYDVPVFVVMFQVDNATDAVVDEFVFDISDSYGERAIRSSESRAVPNFPDGNDAVLVPHNERRVWAHLVERVSKQRLKAMRDEAMSSGTFVAVDDGDDGTTLRNAEDDTGDD